LEVQLWKIGDSPAAPRFNVVSKPNDWSRSIAQRAKTIDDGELTETKSMQRDYWAALNDVLEEYDGAISGNKKPQPQSWMSYPIGHSKMHLGASMNLREGRLRTELYLTGAKAKSFFGQLLTQKEAIEARISACLGGASRRKRQPYLAALDRCRSRQQGGLATSAQVVGKAPKRVPSRLCQSSENPEG
jgi:hypothetical protein